MVIYNILWMMTLKEMNQQEQLLPLPFYLSLIPVHQRMQKLFIAYLQPIKEALTFQNSRRHWKGITGVLRSAVNTLVVFGILSLVTIILIRTHASTAFLTLAKIMLLALLWVWLVEFFCWLLPFSTVPLGVMILWTSNIFKLTHRIAD